MNNPSRGLGGYLKKLKAGTLQALLLLIAMEPGARKSTLMERLGWSKDRLDHALRKLRRLGMVRAEQVKGEGRGHGRNSYRVEYDPD